MKRSVGYLCEDAEIRRNLCAAYAVLGAYSNTESSFEECRFPKPEFFSAERFVLELERRGWKYDRIQRDSRRTIHGNNTAFEPYEEAIPELADYEDNKLSDVEKAVQNAEERIKSVCSSNKLVHIMFGSPKHGKVLSQELYEAGWDWSFHLGPLKFED